MKNKHRGSDLRTFSKKRTFLKNAMLKLRDRKEINATVCLGKSCLNFEDFIEVGIGSIPMRENPQ